MNDRYSTAAIRKGINVMETIFNESILLYLGFEGRTKR